jgi:hypothetical protein
MNEKNGLLQFDPTNPEVHCPPHPELPDAPANVEFTGALEVTYW